MSAAMQVCRQAIENGRASRKLDAVTADRLMARWRRHDERGSTVEEFVMDAAQAGLLPWPRSLMRQRMGAEEFV